LGWNGSTVPTQFSEFAKRSPGFRPGFGVDVSRAFF